ncbi:uncharacterized protein PV09_00039 [Verruconis gallopava]|uniref:Uncharacterized protein n=1 Tax=Verruconis gallopava TaxID=253628 RepID=A0A0D2BCJ5_9PEZI|nr:uncharacterized protein PV09_00039 [Verruconis gallopava]KIW09094.1 hypothetical protein PV09_00039 [Verruconis gallopava]
MYKQSAGRMPCCISGGAQTSERKKRFEVGQLPPPSSHVDAAPGVPEDAKEICVDAGLEFGSVAVTELVRAKGPAREPGRALGADESYATAAARRRGREQRTGRAGQASAISWAGTLVVATAGRDLHALANRAPAGAPPAL